MKLIERGLIELHPSTQVQGAILLLLKNLSTIFLILSY